MTHRVTARRLVNEWTNSLMISESAYDEDNMNKIEAIKDVKNGDNRLIR